MNKQVDSPSDVEEPNESEEKSKVSINLSIEEESKLEYSHVNHRESRDCPEPPYI